MDPSIPMRGPRENLPIPAEVRNMIWKLALIQDNGLPIIILCRFRRGSVKRPLPRTANLGALIRVNKEIREETRPIFYKNNTFAIGNRAWGSIYVPNVLAVKQFLKWIPKEDLKLIAKLVLHVELHGDGWDEGADEEVKRAEGPLKHLSSLTKIVKKRFTGLTAVEFNFCDSDNVNLSRATDNFISYDIKDLLKSNNIVGIVKTVEELLECKLLANFTFVNRDWIDINIIYDQVRNAGVWADNKVIEGDEDIKGNEYMNRDVKAPMTMIKETAVESVTLFTEWKRNSADDYSIPSPA